MQFQMMAQQQQQQQQPPLIPVQVPPAPNKPPPPVPNSFTQGGQKFTSKVGEEIFAKMNTKESWL